MNQKLLQPLCALALIFFSASPCFAQTKSYPTFFSQETYDSAILANAVNHFVELGEEDAIKQLKEIASQDVASGKIDKTFRVGCVCRILWNHKDAPIRPPSLGMYGGGISIDKNKENDLSNWPKYPVAQSGKSYFVVVHGGRFGTGLGPNSGMKKYVDFCHENGTFLSKKIHVPNAEQARADLATLLASARWKNTKGSNDKTKKVLTAQCPEPVK